MAVELQMLSKHIQEKEKEFEDYCNHIKDVKLSNALSLEASKKQVNEAFDRLKAVLEARQLSLIVELDATHAQEQKRVDTEAQSL